MFYHSNNEKPELLRKVVMALTFSVLGYCGNYLSLHVAFNVDFIFGSIFAIFAVVTMGLWWGIGISIIASSYTYQLWNHPYAIFIFAVEILWIGIALRRGKKNILLIDSLYWLILGIPLVIAFYAGPQRLDFQTVIIIALKQPVNGIFNALIASIALSHTPLRKLISGKESTMLPTYSTIIFHLIAVSLMFPSLSLLLYMNHQEVASQQRQAIKNIQTNANKTRTYIQAWIKNYMNAVQVIVSLGEKYPLQSSPGLQEELVQIHKLFPDYHNIFIADANATTIAFDPPINERGESTIGINFADRIWFKQLRNTLKPVVSEVLMGRGGIFSPVFTISVPVVRDGSLAWFGLGAVDLEKLHNHLAIFNPMDDLSLVDQNGNIIVSTNRSKKPLTPIAGTDDGTIVNLSSNVSLWVPGKVKNVSIMTVWKGAYYLTRLPIDGTNWILVTKNPINPIQKHLYDITIWGMGGIAVLYGLSMLLALVFSRRFARSTEALSIITKDIPLKIEKENIIVWPQVDTAEMKQLTNNFKDMEKALRKHIQEVRHVEQQLQQIQKAESLSRMAGAIAHNFNNELSVVLGNLELALDDLPGDTEIHKFLNEAIEAAQRSSKISGLMLTYLGQSTIKLEVLNLAEICRHELPLFHDTIQKNITLETDFMIPGPAVAANANQVRIVLTHLVANSTEAIDDRKGEITLKIKTIPASDIPKIHISPIDWKPDADIFACLEIKDTGCGISDQDIDKIFDPFFTTKFTGRGLGLPVVLGIVKTWKGAVSVESLKDHGSIFRIFLPLSTDEPPGQLEKVTGTDNIEQHGTVLLVDDQDLVRKMIGTILKRLGFSILEAADGIEGLELFAQHREEIRCVITDLTMPGMNGWEIFTALKKIQPNLPVILVSGYDEAQAMEWFDSEKPQAFLRKPFSKAELEKALNKFL